MGSGVSVTVCEGTTDVPRVGKGVVSRVAVAGGVCVGMERCVAVTSAVAVKAIVGVGGGAKN